MKQINTLKKMVVTLIVLVTVMGSSAFADLAIVWGYFTDINYNDLDGSVTAVSTEFQDSVSADGFYSIELPAGTYTFTASSTGHEDEVVQLVVEANQTYQLDFELKPE